MSRKRGETLTVEKLMDGWLVVEAERSPHSTSLAPIMIECGYARESSLGVAKYVLRWLGPDLPRIKEALAVLEGKR